MFSIVLRAVTVATFLASPLGAGLVHAEPVQSGNRALCKSPTGKTYAEGETIQLKVSDGKGGFKTNTYVCTDHGWEKIARTLPGHPPAIGPGTRMKLR